MNTVICANGEILTSKLWRKEHSFFNDLPFYSNIPRMEEMAGPLKSTLSEEGGHRCFCELLVVRFLIIFVSSNLSLSCRNLVRVWMTFDHFLILRESISLYARRKRFFPQIVTQLGRGMHHESGVLYQSL